MSYDVTVGEQEFNYTYNMARFFSRYDVNPVRDLDGQYPEVVAERIAEVFVSVAECDMEELSQRYDSPNGWGSVDTALRFLFDVYMACLTEEADVVEAT